MAGHVHKVILLQPAGMNKKVAKCGGGGDLCPGK